MQILNHKSKNSNIEIASTTKKYYIDVLSDFEKEQAYKINIIFNAKFDPHFDPHFLEKNKK